MTTDSYSEQITEAANYIRSKIGSLTPTIGLILGSGLGDIGNQIEESVFLPYNNIPNFPVSTVTGHEGRLVIGRLEGKTVIAMQGRFHYYEGYSLKKVAFPVYVMKLLGIKTLIITNAAGGMNRNFQAGDLMLITDHINLTGDNPLIGPNEPGLGPRFPDMSEAYYKPYGQLAHSLAREIKDHQGLELLLQEGVYCGISGPAYMTPAELTMLASLGGDAVGMSTVAEVIAANHCGLKVLGLSCITDMAIGEELQPLSHEQVVETANRTKPKFTRLLRLFVREVS
ncbi:MAG TPA: purine-nucleoside phosphorylase [Bacilli bacterium]